LATGHHEGQSGKNGGAPIRDPINPVDESKTQAPELRVRFAVLPDIIEPFPQFPRPRAGVEVDACFEAIGRETSARIKETP